MEFCTWEQFWKLTEKCNAQRVQRGDWNRILRTEGVKLALTHIVCSNNDNLCGLYKVITFDNTPSQYKDKVFYHWLNDGEQSEVADWFFGADWTNEVAKPSDLWRREGVTIN